LFFSSNISCQNYVNKKTATGKVKRLYDRAIQYNRGGHFDKAVKDFQSAIKLDPTFIDAHYQLAAAYFGRKKYDEAIKGLQKVIEIDATYKPQAYYYLGLISWEKDDYENATTYFENYLNSNARKSSRLRPKASSYLASSQFAAKAIKNKVPFDPQPLAKTINTDFPEYLPSITADGETLVFTRRIRGNEDVFISKKKDSIWQSPQPIIDINTEANEGSQYISADGKLIVFVRCSDRMGYGGCDLYFSEKKGAIWSKPKNIGQPINTRAWESQPSLSADGNYLYFASNRNGTLGGRDIWRSRRKADGSWSNPVNLGKTINTEADDESPFIHPDGQTLYFMSSGHPGMGGYDLFKSKRTKNSGWEVPQNLGYPINTKGNEGALFITLDGKRAYFTKDNLPEDALEKLKSKKQPDIFTFELPEHLRPNPVTYVKAQVKDALTKALLEQAEVAIVDLESNEIFSTSYTDINGSFLTCLPLGSNYALNVSKENYLFHSENFELSTESSLQEPFLLKIKLQPIPKETATATTEPAKSEAIILKNVFFESGSAALKSTSLAELNRLKELLENNPSIKIQINGHTDNVGEDDANLKLSEARAKAVKDHLIKEGIAQERLQSKGYGESQPIDTNDTEMGRKNNRRTEFVVQ
jgi:outer membrane protein OmpA-like peptidoglycan-associated protein/Tfp pilus assembly protein PilF